jgi:hypothetical protein
MGWLDQLRTMVYSYFLKAKRPLDIIRTPLSLQKAKTIGILFDATDAENNDKVVAFAQHLKAANKEIQLLGYVDKRDPYQKYPFPFISQKETNWYGKPGGGTAGYFMRSAFDLLINFAPATCLPLDYIAAISPSRFRIGFNAGADIADYDLILISKENGDISNLITNLETYLR